MLRLTAKAFARSVIRMQRQFSSFAAARLSLQSRCNGTITSLRLRSLGAIRGSEFKPIFPSAVPNEVKARIDRKIGMDAWQIGAACNKSGAVYIAIGDLWSSSDIPRRRRGACSLCGIEALNEIIFGRATRAI